MAIPLKLPAERQGIQVLSRAITIMQYLHKQATPQSLSEIAKGVDLPRSTVQRIIDALALEGLVFTGLNNVGVRLGAALIPLADVAGESIVEIAQPILRSLAEATGESVALVTLDEGEVSVLAQVQGANRLVSVLSVGATLPAHCSASGKVLLAHDKDSVNVLLGSRELVPYTENTITSKDKFIEEMEIIRQSEIAWDREEHSIGICSAAIAIGNTTGLALALAVSTPKERLLPNKDNIIEQLKKYGTSLRSLLDAT